MRACECDKPDCSWCDSAQRFGTVEVPKDRLGMLWGAILAAGVKEGIAGEPMPELSAARMAFLVGVIHGSLYKAFAAVTDDIPDPIEGEA